MSKQTVECPYTVGSAKQIWAEGLKEGIRLAMEYSKSKKTMPIESKHFNISYKKKDEGLDAMRGTN